MREGHKHSTEVRSDVQTAFSQIAARYLRHRRTALLLLLPCAVSFVVTMIVLVVAPSFSSSMSVLFLFCLSVWCIALLTMPKLSCPSCTKELQRSFGRYCPDCGSPGLDSQRQSRSVRCRACGKSNLRQQEQFRIRFCTHCGAMLAQDGIARFRGSLWGS